MRSSLARLGHALLRVFPSDFRERFGDDIADHISTRSSEIRARRGPLSLVRFWVKAIVDVVRAAAAERREERAMQRPHGSGSALSDLKLDVHVAFRALRRSPAFTAVALLTLALGIGGSTAMFSILNTAMGRALPYPESDRLVMGRGTYNGNVSPLVTLPDYEDYRDQAESLKSLAAFGSGTGLATVTGTGEPEQARIAEITGNLFETLGVPPVLGSTFTIEERPQEGDGEVVISHSFWQRWFGGSADVLGQTLIVNGSPALVVGVMPAGFHFYFDVDIWRPPWSGASEPINRRYNNWLLVGRLAPEVTLRAARSEIDVISMQLQEAYPDTNRDRALQLDNLHEAMVEAYRQSLFALVGAIVFVLLIACSNVASLLMARGSSRASELAVRASLGASGSRLARHLLAECLILALAAGGMGVAMAVWLQDAILGFLSMDSLGIGEVGLSGTMLSIALAVSLATVILFGVFPSILASRPNLAAELKQGSRGSTSAGGVRYRSGLVVLQVALSLILLVGSGLLLKSFAELSGVDPGFRVENLLTATVSLPSDDYAEVELQTQFFESLKEGIQALPGVQSVGVVSRLPILQIWGNAPFWSLEQPPVTRRDAHTADQRTILPGYFETMEIPLVEGRLLKETDGADSPPVIVLTRRAAELVFYNENAVGRQVAVDMWDDEPSIFGVVGVVENHQLTSLSGSVRPAVFFTHAQRPRATMRIAVATAVNPDTLIRPVQERIWQLDRGIVLSEAQTMEAAVSHSIAGVRSVTAILSMFATVALALTALGLYGVLAFFVTQRMHEIGIRVALGAGGGSVLRLVVNQGMKLVGVGSVLGILGAVGATRLVRGMLFQISATDPGTFAGVTAFFLLVTLGACLLPAWRALRVDPVEAFRAE
jgi:putative ABC transport system permease protein